MKLQEQHIYGSARLGVVKPDIEMIGAVDPSDVGEFDRVRGMKRYELANHLGNVLTVISDRKIATVDNGVNIYYHAEIISYSDYYPFGAPMSQGTTDRTWSVEEYRFGFNGKERELQITGFNTHTSAEFWMYDSRIGRRWNVDPVYKHEMSSYSCFSNSPSNRVDPKGDSDDKPNVSNSNNPNAKGGKDKFHKETMKLRQAEQKRVEVKLEKLEAIQTTYVEAVNKPATEPESIMNQQSPTVLQMQNDSGGGGGVPQVGLQGGEHLVGPTLYALGQPVNFLKPIGALNSKPGSSIASSVLSKTFPQTFTGTFGKPVGTKIVKKVGTNVMGRALGRFVPVAGWGLTAYDFGSFLIDNRESFKQGMEARDKYIQKGLIPPR